MGDNLKFSVTDGANGDDVTNGTISEFTPNMTLMGLGGGPKLIFWTVNPNMWEPLGVSNVETVVSEWLPLPDVAEMLDVSVTKVHSLVKDGSLLAARVGERNIRAVPAEFILGDHILESLRGTITVLQDAGFSDEDAIVWLYTQDASLPGRPIDALREGRKTEIRRRASALGW